MARSRERNTESSRTPGSQQPHRTVGGDHTVLPGQPGKRSPLGSHDVHLHAAHGAGGPGGFEAPPGFKWIADAAHPTLTRGAKQRRQHPGKSVNVFVGVDVAYGDTTRLNAPYLGDGLGLNLLLADAAAQQISKEASHRGPERRGVPRDRPAKALRPGAGTASRRPVPRDSRLPGAGWAKAIYTAGEKKAPLAISVAELRAPACCSSTMARLTPGARPKSSALMIRRFISASVPSDQFRFRMHRRC